MVKKNVLVVNKNNEGYFAYCDDREIGKCCNITACNKSSNKNRRGYVNFQGLVEAIISIPKEFYEPGVTIDFDVDLSSSRVLVDEPSKKAIKSLVGKLSEYARDAARYKTTLISVAKIANGEKSN